MSWQDDLAYIREVAPDEPKLRAAVKRLWHLIERLEGGGTGVREPREPSPESPGDAVAVEEDWPVPAPIATDYWETAE